MRRTTGLKKGNEEEELRSILRNPPSDGDPSSTRQALRRVITLMTSGIDTTSLFPDVIMSSFTDDLASKKLLYLYLTMQSRGKEDLAVLAINALEKECRDKVPIVRGLALRSLAAMHVANLEDHLLPLLEKGLRDSSAYVRRTAVCCLLRIYHRTPELFFEQHLLEKALEKLKDGDLQVSCNALSVILEISAAEASLDVPHEGHQPFLASKPFLYHMLNRLRLMNEWQQITVMNLILSYTPQSEEEMFEIMNLLDERLESINTAVVMACTNVFLHLTQNSPATQRQVYQRLQQPLLMAAMSDTPEAAYAAMCHISLIAKREPRLFASHYQAFYCYYREASYMQHVKMSILASITTMASATGVIEELVAYSESRVASVACKAIATMGQLASRLTDTLPTILKYFMDFICLGLEDVRAATLKAVADVTRQTASTEAILPLLEAVVTCYLDVPFSDEESRLVFVYLLGAYGEHLADAPYLMEILAENALKESAPFRLHLLSAAVVLFFKRPPEMQALLGRLFEAFLSDFSNADVLDQALWYYRLLQTDPHAAARVVGTQKSVISAFEEDIDSNLLDRLMAEFDTCSVVYGVPRKKYCQETTGICATDDDEEEEEEEEEEEAEQEENMLRRQCSSESIAVSGDTDALVLSSDVEIGPEDFQSAWATATCSIAETILGSGPPPLVEQLEDALASANIFVLAIGPEKEAVKLFLYARSVTPGSELFLIEAFALQSGSIQLTIKSTADVERLRKLSEVIRAAVSTVARIDSADRHSF